MAKDRKEDHEILTKKLGTKIGIEFSARKRKSVTKIVFQNKETPMIMKNYVADELANKVYHLTKALQQANDIIHNLEIQNEILTDALSGLSQENTKDENHSLIV